MAKVQLEIRGSREFVWHVGDRVSLFGMSRGAISAKLLEILLVRLKFLYFILSNK